MIALSPDGSELAGLVSALLEDLREDPARSGLLGICGAPGSGKSTLAAALGLPVVPMDGFHLADVELERRGLLSRKGAPETFDPWGYAALLGRIREHADHLVMAPAFERELEQPIAGALPIPRSTLVATEGNYLLLDGEPWRAVHAQLDRVWHLDCDQELRIERLVERHIRFGKSAAEALEWVRRVDQPNADLVQAARERADLVLDVTTWSGAPLPTDYFGGIRMPPSTRTVDPFM